MGADVSGAGCDPLHPSSGVAVDSAGDVIITGDSDAGLFTAKFSGTSGALLWDRRRSSSGEDEGSGVAVDALGRVSIVGRIDKGSELATYLGQYSAAGALMWEKRIGSATVSGNGGLILDATGNPIVAAARLTETSGSRKACATMSREQLDGACAVRFDVQP